MLLVENPRKKEDYIKRYALEKPMSQGEVN
jgi:hypothetical protein